VHEARWRIFSRTTRRATPRPAPATPVSELNRDQRREGDGKSELPVELSVRTTDECDRNEAADNTSAMAMIGPLTSPSRGGWHREAKTFFDVALILPRRSRRRRRFYRQPIE
jgi:hypothetical protein